MDGAAAQVRRGERYVRVPLHFIKDVCRLTDSRYALPVALLIWRRTFIEKSRTVKVTSVDLADIGLDRHHKHKALVQLQRAGLVKVTAARGKAGRVTMLWRPPKVLRPRNT